MYKKQESGLRYYFGFSNMNMFKTLYKKYPYFFNLLIVLVLLIIIRILDGIAWYPPSPENTKVILFIHLFEFIAFIPMLFLLIYSYRWAIKRRQTALLITFIIVFAVFGPTLIKLLTTWLEVTFWRTDIGPVTLDKIEKYTPGCLVIILFLSVTFYLTHLRFQSNKQREAIYKAENLTKEVQLKMLYYQINPHFLFNVLNSIHALIDEDADKAKKLVVEMSDYYRYTLNKQEQTISIEKEIQSVVKYLEIQKIRFEEEYEFEISVDPAINTVTIPSFIIHLLVENAVKYCVKTREQKLGIRLSVKLFDRLILIEVSNTGKLVAATAPNHNPADGTGNVIENIKNRLAMLYADNYSFSLMEENNWVVATIEIRNIQI